MEELGTVMRNLGMEPTEDDLKEQIRLHDSDGWYAGDVLAAFTVCSDPSDE